MNVQERTLQRIEHKLDKITEKNNELAVVLATLSAKLEATDEDVKKTEKSLEEVKGRQLKWSGALALIALVAAPIISHLVRQYM